MANSDDPPYLTVGTEVSAKYRGAFCEATIKVAKKLVKCKVSYGKGHSAVVSDDYVQGTLKVGVHVNVTQPDGQVLNGNIVKLTDQSTYTVVFDDGDERTLKRSSLCLKGGRHFDKSESLDHLPLTDPEHFGAPILPKKQRRRAVRVNYNTSMNGDEKEDEEEDEERGGDKKGYPPEYPVGKTVFLENDRRRAGWIPAVIVPAHYVLEESDRKPNTICLRSFKDGRFFAVTKNELHEFSPSKEPLLSMLEGDIQPMYMCKPAIERAMAYLDTGELPWNMDLFDGQTERPGRRESKNAAVTPTGSGMMTPSSSMATDDNTASSQQTEAERNQFMEKLRRHHETKGSPLTRTPILAQKDLDLYRLYRLVQENGGMESVTREMKWRSLYLQLGIPLSTNASHALKQAYKKYLHAFECYEKGKGRPKESPLRGRKRAGGVLSGTEGGGRGGVEEAPGTEEPKVKLEPGELRNTRLSKNLRDDPLLRNSRVPPPPQDLTPPSSSVIFGSSSFITSDSPSSPLREHRPPPPPPPIAASRGGGRGVNYTRGGGGGRVGGGGGDLLESPQTAGSPMLPDFKSELSDHESCQGDTTSSTTGEEGEEGGGGGGESWTGKREDGLRRFSENDRVSVWYGSGKNMEMYEAKIIGMEENEDKREYLVHYSGWNNRYNEWIDESRIVKKVVNPTKHARPPYKKKKSKVPVSEKRKIAREIRGGGGGRGGSVEQLFSRVATTEERVPPPPTATPTATPTLLEQPVSEVTHHLGSGPHHPTKPPSAKRRRFSGSNHLIQQDFSSPSPPLPPPHHQSHISSSSSSSPPSSLTTPAVVSRLSSPPLHPSPPPPPPPNLSLPTSSNTFISTSSHHTQDKNNTSAIPSSFTSTSSTSSSSSSSSTTTTTTTTTTTMCVSDHRHLYPAVTQTLVPPPQLENTTITSESPQEVEMDCAIEVKKEVNYRVLSPPTPPPSVHEKNDDSHNSCSLLCPEMLLGPSRLRSTAAPPPPPPPPQSHIRDENKMMTRVNENTEQSATTSLNSDSTTESSTDEESKSPLPPLLSPIHSPPPHEDLWSSPATTQIRHEDEEDAPLGLFEPRERDDEVEEEEEEEEEEEDNDEEQEAEEEKGVEEEDEERGDEGMEEEREEEDDETRMEAEKSADEKSSVVSSEKETSPDAPLVPVFSSKPPVVVVGGGREEGGDRGSLLAISSSNESIPRTPGGGEGGGEKRRRVRETDEEYALRRMARRESLKFVIDFSMRPEMKCGERVKLIEEHIRLLQHKWSDLKSEVAQLDRRRRRARRKEREAARILAQAHQYHQSTPSQNSSTHPVECH